MESPITNPVFALDIGGSLAKLAYERKFRYARSIPCTTKLNHESSPFAYDYCEREYEGRRVCLIKFETSKIGECLQFIRSTVLLQNPADLDKAVQPSAHVRVTGGGAFRFRELIMKELGVQFDKEDEIDCLVRGCVFMLRNIPDELFFYDKSTVPEHVFVQSSLVDTFPFLLVNIGSGVSILKVESPNIYSRVGGTSIGGGTFLGIGSLLCGGRYSFDQLLEMADEGDHRKVDMLVRDIYGGNYEALGLQGDVIASSFGLAARATKQPRCLADMIKALLITVSNNIGQLACLYAKQHNLTRILFGGFFIRGHGLTMEVITYAVNYWSGGAHRAHFLRHEGYLGVIGAFVKALNAQAPVDDLRSGWSENYVSVSKVAAENRRNSCSFADTLQFDTLTSSTERTSFSFTPSEGNRRDNNDPAAFNTDVRREIRTRRSSSIKHIPMDTNYLELDSFLGSSLEVFPLLACPMSYIPDTWDLTQDTEARTYWLDCLERGVERQRVKAEESQSSTMPDPSGRARLYAERYVNYLNELRQNPSSAGVLTVRSMLSAQQHFLREFGFGDIFSVQKKVENRSALAMLPARLQHLSNLNWHDRQLDLIRTLLAGNLFDWGAIEMVKFFSEATTDKLGVPELSAGLDKIPDRPWLIDDYDRWLKAVSPDREKPYQCALIFCDNSGPDVILGVLPLALEFIGRGTKVILAANSGPAINDVTHQELEIIMRLIAFHEPVVAAALSSGHLLVAENGQSSPCLDLRLTASTLVQLVKREMVDLIIIEGMGRAVHTNLYADFAVDCLKVAVIKNAWLAQHLGGELYSVMFRFQCHADAGEGLEEALTSNEATTRP